MADKDDKKQTEAERKLEIARKLAAKAFSSLHATDAKHVDTSDRKYPLDSIRRNLPTGRQLAIEIVNNPQYTALYSMEIESEFSTQQRLSKIIPQLEKLSSFPNSSVKILAQNLCRMLKDSFLNCEVHIGISADASVTMLDFVSEGNYWRKVYRGQSSCFECLDQRDAVLQVAPSQPSGGNFASGESILYVPLFSDAGNIGVIEIHGLQSENLTLLKNFERSTEMIQSMMNNKDFSFQKHVKLYRLPNVRTGGVVSELDTNNYNVANYHYVVGVISDIATEINGVPFFGGPRYTVEWEDGLIEKNVLQSELLKAYKNTPQSLGVVSTLTEQLLEELVAMAKDIAIIIQKQRRIETLKIFQNSLQMNIRNPDIVDRSFQVINSFIRGVRECIICGYIDHSDGVTESTLTVLHKKVPQIRYKEKKLQRTIYNTIAYYMHQKKKKAEALVETVDEYNDLRLIMGTDIVTPNATPASPSRPSTDPDDSITVPDQPDDNMNPIEWYVKEIFLPDNFRWNPKIQCERYFVVITKSRNTNEETSLEDTQFIHEVLKFMSDALKVACFKETRKDQRKELMSHIEESIVSLREMKVDDLCTFMLKIIAVVAPNTNVYMGFMKPGGKRVVFESCSANSSMKGQVLARGEGISFDVIQQLETLIVSDGDTNKKKLVSEGQLVNVKYGRKYFLARVLRNRGHEFYDVHYIDDNKKEIAVHLSRIVPLATAFKMKIFGEFQFPVVCVPLRYLNKGVGVLILDSFGSCEKAPYDKHPEQGLKSFLEHLGKVVGSTVDLNNKKASLRALAKVSQNPNATPDDLYNAISSALVENLFFLTHCAIYNMKYQVGGKHKNDVIKTKWSSLYNKGGHLHKDIMVMLENFDPMKSSMKPVQEKTPQCVWLLCKATSRLLNTDRSTDPNATHDRVCTSVFIVIIRVDYQLVDVDLEFLQAIQKLCFQIFQNMENKKLKAQIRIESLREISQLCGSWREWICNRDELFLQISDLVNNCYVNASVYFGKLRRRNESIEFVFASKYSKMKGKRLLRKDAKGLSFSVIDNFSRIFISKTDSAKISALQIFGGRENLQFPVVFVPVVSYTDAAFGVLVADGCEDISDAHNEKREEVLNFFYEVANYLSPCIKGFTVTDFIQSTRGISIHKNPSACFSQLHMSLLDLLPYGQNVFEVLVHPTQQYNRNLISYIDDTATEVTKTSVELILFIRIVSVTAHHNYSAMYFNLSYRGKFLFTRECNLPIASDDADSFIKIAIPAHTQFKDIEVKLMMSQRVRGSDKEVAKRVLNYFYLTNTTTILTEHSIVINNETQQIADIAVGSVRTYELLLSADDAMRFKICAIAVRGIQPHVDNKKFNFGAKKSAISKDIYYVRVKFNRVEVMKSDPIKLSSGVLNIKPSLSYLMLDRSDYVNGNNVEILLFEEFGRDCLGTIALQYTDLLRVHESPEWLRMTDGSEIQLKLEFLHARDMTTEHIIEEFQRIPSSETTLTDVVDISNEEVQTQNCYIEISAVRNLVLPLNKSVKSILGLLNEDGSLFGDHAEQLQIVREEFHPFCIVYLNQNEIMKTSYGHRKMISDSCHDQIYCFEEESCVFAIPNHMSLEECAINVDVFIEVQVNEADKQYRIGSTEITGKVLSSLFGGSAYNHYWLDVQSQKAAAELVMSSKDVPGLYSTGELLVSGRPLEVEPINQLLDPADLVYPADSCLFLQLKKFDVPITSCIIVYWNGLEVLRGNDASICEKAVHLRRPMDIPLRECVLEISSVEYDASQEYRILGKCKLKAEALSQLFNSKTKKLAWKTLSRIGMKNDVIMRVLLHCGHATAADGVDVEEEIFYLDILKGFKLVKNVQFDGGVTCKPNTFVKVFWNGSFLGRSAICWDTSDPSWSDQRYELRVPVSKKHDVEALGKILKKCVLKVEVWAVAPLVADASSSYPKLLGVISFRHGGEFPLDDFLRFDKSMVKWCTLRSDQRMSDEAQSQLSGELKLQCGSPHAAQTVSQSNFLEYRIRIVKAMELSEMDVFLKTSCVVIVYWNSLEIKRSSIVQSSLNPVFCNEHFLLRVPHTDKIRDQSLQFCLYDTLNGSICEFLGMIEFTGDRLERFLVGKMKERDYKSHEDGYEFVLQKNSELNEEENKHVHGSIYLASSLEDTYFVPTATCMDKYFTTALSIVSAKNLPLTDFFAKKVNVQCIVYWSSELDNIEKKYIGSTPPLYGASPSPTWAQQSYHIPIPKTHEWHRVTVRIECWDLTSSEDLARLEFEKPGSLNLKGYFLGYIELTGATLEQLLGRKDDQCLEVKSYPLLAVESSSFKVQGELSLSGGLTVALFKRDNSFLALSDDVSLESLAEDIFDVESVSEKASPKVDETNKPKRKFGNKLLIQIHALVNGKVLDESSTVYYVVGRFNSIEVRRELTVKVNNVTDVQFLDDTIAFYLPESNDPSECVLEVELWMKHQIDSSIGIDGAIVTDVVDNYFGMITVSGNDLLKLLRPRAGMKAFTLQAQNKKNIPTDRIFVNRGSNLRITGRVPDLVNALSLKESRVMSRGGSRDWRTMSSRILVDGDEEAKFETFQVHICEAQNLYKGIGTVYTEIYWNGEKIGTTAGVRGVAEATASSCAVWENELFFITPQKPRENILLIEVMEKRTFGSDSFLGCVLLRDEDLKGWLQKHDPSWFNLRLNSNRNTSTQSKVQGRIFMSAKQVDGSAKVAHQLSRSLSIDADSTTNINTPLPVGYQDVILNILSGRHIYKNQPAKDSTVFAVIKWNDVEMASCDVGRRSIDPVWEMASVKMRVPINLGPVSKPASKEGRDSRPSINPDDVAALARSKSRRGGGLIQSVKRDALEAKLNCTLAVELWERYSTSEKSTLLGAAELKSTKLADFFANIKPYRKTSLVLETSSKYPRKQQRVNKNAAVDVLVEIASSATSHEKPASALEIQVSGVSNLPSCNPYCIVKYNYHTVGITPVRRNCKDPKWNNAKYIVPLTSPLRESYVSIEVWGQTNKDQLEIFYGGCEYEADELVKLATQQNATVAPTPLKKLKYYSDTLQKQLFKANLHFKCEFKDTSLATNIMEGHVCYEILLLAAQYTIVNNEDCICVLKLNNKEVYKTDVCTGPNLKWIRASYVLDIDSIQTDVEPMLIAELWTVVQFSRGDFLGCAVIPIASVQAMTAKEMRKPKAYPLQRSTCEIPHADPQGELLIHIKMIEVLPETEETKGEQKSYLVEPTWQPLEAAGKPYLNLSIANCTNLIPLQDPKNMSEGNDAICILYVNDVEVGMTSVCSFTDATSPHWENETFSLRIPPYKDKYSFQLVIEMWEMNMLQKGRFLGQVALSFWSLWLLSSGKYTFFLSPLPTDLNYFVKGSMTIVLDTCFPVWDTLSTHPSPFVRRSITVHSATELPLVNGEPPSCFIVLVVDGLIRGRSSVIPYNSNPVWITPLYSELLIHLYNAYKVVLQVVHSDNRNKRDVMIGEITLQKELFVRLSNNQSETINCYISIPSKVPPKGYEFMTDGFISITIGASGSSQMTNNPWSSREKEPLLTFPVNDITENFYGPKDEVVEINPQAKLLLGTSTNYAHSSILPTDPTWALIPVKDIGFQLDNQIFGTAPGLRLVVALERQKKKLCESDVSVINEVYADIQKCVLEIRRMELFRRLREKCLSKIQQCFDQMTKARLFDINKIMQTICQNLCVCFPGASVYLSLASRDFSHMKYVMYEPSYENPLLFTLYQRQGFEWSSVGRHATSFTIDAPSSLTEKNFKDFNYVSYVPFAQMRFPRVVVPIRAGDISLGMLGFENFDIYKSGAYEPLANKDELLHWLEEVGLIAGKLFYDGREQISLHALQSFLLSSVSDYKHLLRNILICSLKVLQGCRLMEIWQIKKAPPILETVANPKTRLKPTARVKEYEISSVLHAWPVSDSLPTKYLKLCNVQITVTPVNQTVKTPPTKTFMGLLKGRQAAPVISRSMSIDSVFCSANNYVVGINYNGFEQIQILNPVEAAANGENFVFTLKDIILYLTSDRNIYISVYETNSQNDILRRNAIVYQLITLNEKEINRKLVPDAKINETLTYNFQCRCIWPQKSGAAQRAAYSKLLQQVYSFPFQIISAKGLKSVDLVGSSDPFCELYCNGTLIGKTSVQRNNVNPVWNETIELVLSSLKGATDVNINIEVFDMTLMGKGESLGEVELTLEQLLNPPDLPIEIPLSERAGQKSKGTSGSLTLLHSIVKQKMEVESQATVSKNPEEDALVRLRTVKRISSYYEPILQLTVDHAENLTLKNAYVNIYVVDVIRGQKMLDELEPVAVTRVIENTQHPSWNQTIVISLNLPKDTRRDVSIDDMKLWPRILIEVFDKDASFLGGDKFLGSAEISPQDYSFLGYTSYVLQPSQKYKKQTKHIGGSIFLKYHVEENTATTDSQQLFFSPHRMLDMTYFIDVQIQAVRGLVAGVFGKLSPYCVVSVDGQKIGETSTKKATATPSWSNEKFSLRLSQLGYGWKHLTVDVFSRSGNKKTQDGTLLGRCQIPLLEVIYPSTGELTAPLKVNDVTKATLVYRMTRYEVAQHVSVLPRRLELLDGAIVEGDIDLVSNPLQDHFKDTKFQLVNDKMEMKIVLDPITEQERQEKENISLPNILKKLQEDTLKYFESSFDQCGLISELHLGQVLSSLERDEKTVLHLEQSDVFVLPMIYDDPSNPAGETLALVTRYNTGKIPKRDVDFLYKLRKVILSSFSLFTSKSKREFSRKNLLETFQNMSDDIKRYPIDQLYMQMLQDITAVYPCEIKYYSVEAMTTGRTLYGLQECDLENGCLKATSRMNELALACSTLCNHGLMIQGYRGEVRVASQQWEKVSQSNLQPLNDVVNVLSNINASSICEEIIALMKSHATLGSCMIPVKLGQEVLVGVLAINGIDRLPQSIYHVASEEKKHVECEWLEEGISEHMLRIGEALGRAIFKSRVNEIVRDLKTYVVREYTDERDILRYTIRRLITAIPLCEEITLWRVLLPPVEVMTPINVDNVVKPANTGRNILSNLFKGWRTETPASTPPIAPPTPQMPLHTSGSITKHSVLVAGTFDIDIHKILQLPDERQIAQMKATLQYNATLSSRESSPQEGMTRAQVLEKQRKSVATVDASVIHSNTAKVQSAEEQYRQVKWIMRYPNLDLSQVTKDEPNLEEEGSDSSDDDSVSERSSIIPKESASDAADQQKTNEERMLFIHSEIYRNIKDLKKSSFHISNGYYVSCMPSSAHVALKPLFACEDEKIPKTESSEAPPMMAEAKKSQSASFSSEIAENPLTKQESANKTQPSPREKKPHIAGASNAGAKPKLEKKKSKIPMEGEARPPLPPGPPPKTPDTSNTEEKSTHVPDKQEQSGLEYEFVFVVRASGVGMNGYGVVGSEIGDALNEVSVALTSLLVKVHANKQKSSSA